MTPLLKPSLFPTSLILRFVLNLSLHSCAQSHNHTTLTQAHSSTYTLVFSLAHYSNSLCLAPTFVLYLYSDLSLTSPVGRGNLVGDLGSQLHKLSIPVGTGGKA